MINLINTHQSFFQLSPQAAGRLVEKVDINRDHQIDFREFTLLMLEAKKEKMKHLAIQMGTSVLSKDRTEDATNYLLEYSCWPPPLFIIFASIFEIIFYFYYAYERGYGLAPNAPAPTWSPLILNPYHKEWIWTYFSYTLIHVGYMHLISNLIMQLVLGISLELVHKWIRIGGLFLLGAFTGALLFWVFDPHVYLAGASGGVYALLTAHLADVILNWSEMPYRWARVAIFGIFVSADFGYAAYERFFVKADVKVSQIKLNFIFISVILDRRYCPYWWSYYWNTFGNCLASKYQGSQMGRLHLVCCSLDLRYIQPRPHRSHRRSTSILRLSSFMF